MSSSFIWAKNKPIYLLDAIFMCRIFLAALRSKDCLHPCRSYCLEVNTLLPGVLLLRRKVPAMVTLICHDRPILIASGDFPPQKSGGGSSAVVIS
jgi:hypothetical protein